MPAARHLSPGRTVIACLAFLSIAVPPSASRLAYAQAAPGLATLVSSIPADATSVSIHTYSLDTIPYVTLRYFSASSSPNITYGIYNWDGQEWNQVYDVYNLGHDDCQTNASLNGITSGNPCDLGDLTLGFDGEWGLLKLSGDTSKIPDMLAIDILYQGTIALQNGHALVFLRPSIRGFDIAATLTFGRPAVRSVFMSSCSGSCGNTHDQITVEANAYLTGDRGCCPTGYGYFIFDWTGSDLTVSERCTMSHEFSDFGDPCAGQ
jgi:hypothetical protein